MIAPLYRSAVAYRNETISDRDGDRTVLLGCIADDITGATDLALMLARSGMRTVQVMGVPETGSAFEGYDAVVVALKSRTNPVEEAIAWSSQSCDVLLAAGARQIFFKYCSTFDSTDQGNIGPVAEALMGRLNADIAVVCPAFPENGRSIYQGHLFVGDTLLSDSPMRDHPLNPMRDSSLVRVMSRQTRLPVHLVPLRTIAQGDHAVETAFAGLTGDGPCFAVTDAVADADLMTIGKAAANHRLLTGGSGLAMGLADNFVAQGLMQKTVAPTQITARPGRAAILAGSCSAATRKQIATAQSAGVATFKIDVEKLKSAAQTPQTVLAWAASQPGEAPILIYSSDEPDNVSAVQETYGRDAAGQLIERTLATVASGLVDDRVSRLIVAGGETSGAVADALGVRAIEIGPEIDPGVPWVKSLDARELVLAFKSGNFGADDFFLKAWELLR